mgnify:FL=1|tara:strand:- start:3625 stop:4263 length:639 start_codon:yes stop_codon:yes gene_type:complete
MKLLENKSLTREQWLSLAKNELTSKVFKLSEVTSKVGKEIDVPSDIKISCGFPPSGGKRTKNKTLGVCFNRESSKSNINEIFVSPVVEDSMRVLDILAHEMIHAIDDCKSGHKGTFRKIAKAIGLEGKMTATTAGDWLKGILEGIIKSIGKYPHAEVSTGGIKKQTTRMIKVACTECEFSYRTSRKNIDLMINYVCNSCGMESLEPEVKEEE